MYKNYRQSGINIIWLIIAVNIMLFIATSVNRQLLFEFGLRPVDVLDKPWTILTSMFVHVGLWHIIANMWTLYFFGTYVSGLVGEQRFLIVYFLGGILGGIAYALLGSPNITAVGASGAVFALGGTLTVMRPKLSVYIFPIPKALPLWIAITGLFVVMSFIGGIAWQGHLGGLVLGLIAGYFFRNRERRAF